MSYDLYYWPFIPGRGEYVRLVLEAVGATYRDVARESGEGAGLEAMTAGLKGRYGPQIPFAPPYLVDGEIVLSQTPVIVAYLGEKHGLAPALEADRLFARAVAVTTADFAAEIHDTHHPVGTGLYYEDQKEEARRRAEGFRNERAPKFLGWYEALLDANPSGPNQLLGSEISYVDLGLYHTVEGLKYAFPRLMARISGDYPHVMALCERVAALPGIAQYLASDRRMAFNEDGLFRHYPELDEA